MSEYPVLFAVVAVWRRGDMTYYVKRSASMRNYPSVWSIPSIQFVPAELPDPRDLSAAEVVFRRMSEERFNGQPLRVLRHLSSADAPAARIGRHVFMHLYEIAFETEPKTDPEYYAEAAWLTSEQYTERAVNAPCGLCMRMYSDYCVQSELCDVPFAPSVLSMS